MTTGEKIEILTYMSNHEESIQTAIKMLGDTISFYTNIIEAKSDYADQQELIRTYESALKSIQHSYYILTEIIKTNK